MLGIQSPMFKNSLRQVLLREDYFPLTLTPLGERGKSETDLMPYGY
jgi:hypothetical protein